LKIHVSAVQFRPRPPVFASAKTPPFSIFGSSVLRCLLFGS
jgi:hypothetical protein